MDNAIILQEVLHYMNKSQRKKGDMVVQLDLEKAYNRVDWDFVRDTLILYGFPNQLFR